MSDHSQILLRKLVASHKDFLLGHNDIGPSRPLGGHVAGSLLPELPRATAIARDLEATGLKSAVAQQISDAYLKSADDLRERCQTSLQSAFVKASAKNHLSQEEVQAMIEAWAATYARQMRCWAENALSRARDAVAKVQPSSTNEKKPVFNHFQNHRNRAKKEGRKLRKLANEALPSELSLKSLEEKMPYFTIPMDKRKPLRNPSPVSDDLSDTEQVQTTKTPLSVSSPISDNTESNPLNPPRSRQAFPVIYVHRGVDCFSKEPGTYKFPSSPWLRKPAGPSRPSQSHINMSEFILEFSQKLHLRTTESKSPRSQ
ncbi:hypothetical protein C0992_007045, partial [Termitomyces sp. T32_za158]